MLQRQNIVHCSYNLWSLIRQTVRETTDKMSASVKVKLVFMIENTIIEVIASGQL